MNIISFIQEKHRINREISDFDTLKIKGEEDKALKIIAGDSSFDLDLRNKVCNLVQIPQSRKPEGSFFINLAKSTMYYAFRLF